METPQEPPVRGASSFREHRHSCENTYFFREFVAYFALPNSKGARKDQKGGARTKCRMGVGAGGTPGHRDTLGWRARGVSAKAPEQRGYDKLELSRNVRRVAQNSAIHTVGRKTNGEVSVHLLHSDPKNPDTGKIARVCKYVLCYGCKGAGKTMIQRNLWRAAAQIRWAHRRRGALRKAP